jgi:hypothetical protein
MTDSISMPDGPIRALLPLPEGSSVKVVEDGLFAIVMVSADGTERVLGATNTLDLAVEGLIHVFTGMPGKLK